MGVLAADHLRSFFSRCPPRTFLPALCKIFLDESAPDNVLEVTARAITYYLDVSAECTRRIVGVDGAIKALCNRLVVVELNNRTSRDLAEQCVKVGGRYSYLNTRGVCHIQWCMTKFSQMVVSTSGTQAGNKPPLPVRNCNYSTLIFG